MVEPNDVIDVRIPASCPGSISQILYHAWHHDLVGLKPLLNVPGRASVQEPTTGETPLHATVRACAPANRDALDGGDAEVVDRAKAVIHELFMSGAIWNDVDNNDETPGCLAARLGLKDLYTLCVEAGVRAELLFGLLDGYEVLDSDDDDDEEEGEEGEDDGGDDESAQEEHDGGETADGDIEAGATKQVEAIVDSDRAFVPPKRAAGPHVNSDEYLRSNLTYGEGKLVDSSQNGVMSMYIEILIMSPYKTVSCLTPISLSGLGNIHYAVLRRVTAPRSSCRPPYSKHRLWDGYRRCYVRRDASLEAPYHRGSPNRPPTHQQQHRVKIWQGLGS